MRTASLARARAGSSTKSSTGVHPHHKHRSTIVFATVHHAFSRHTCTLTLASTHACPHPQHQRHTTPLHFCTSVPHALSRHTHHATSTWRTLHMQPSHAYMLGGRLDRPGRLLCEPVRQPEVLLECVVQGRIISGAVCRGWEPHVARALLLLLAVVLHTRQHTPTPNCHTAGRGRARAHAHAHAFHSARAPH